MGAPMITLFLQRQTNAWKAKYVARIMTLCGAYGGSAKAIKVYALGDDLGAFALRASVMRPGQITSPSLAWLLPNPLFWKPDEVLVKTKSRNYTMAQVQDYLMLVFFDKVKTSTNVDYEFLVTWVFLMAGKCERTYLNSPTLRLLM